jgi:hypothetical protein
VTEDLLAAARALLGRKPGFAAILGTGTNSCLYDGKKIIYNVDSLGYFLGDEGSGSYFGKRLLRDYLRGLLPDGLQEKFRETYNLGSRNDILDRLYNQPLPNRFLASFSKFTYDHNNVSYCREIVLEGFEMFFQNLVLHYPNYQDYSFNCVGSVGYNFRDVLSQVARGHGMEVAKSSARPSTTSWVTTRSANKAAGEPYKKAPLITQAGFFASNYFVHSTTRRSISWRLSARSCTRYTPGASLPSGSSRLCAPAA